MKIIMHMNSYKKLASLLSVLAVAGVLASSSAMAVSSSDVAVTINEPTADSTESVGGIMDSGIAYEVEIDNIMTNNSTTVDTKLTVSDNSGNTVTKWVNSTSVSSEGTKTITGEINPDKLNVNDTQTLTAEATFTDDSDSTTATITDSVSFELSEALGWDMFMSLIELMIVLAVLGAVYDRLS